MHWAAHGHTAADIVYERADANKSNMGMSSFNGNIPTKNEVSVAKNYLDEEELEILNRIVNMYLEFAELQAKSRKQMYMQDWIKKLDDFLQISDFEVLKTKGSISHKQALDKANLECQKYKEQTKNKLSKVEKDFIKNIENTAKELEKK